MPGLSHDTLRSSVFITVRGIQFPDQGSNPGPLHWECSLSHWAAREVQRQSINSGCVSSISLVSGLFLWALTLPFCSLSCAFLKSHCEYPLLGPADLGGFPRLCSPLHVQIWKTQEEFREGWFRSGSRRIPLGPVSGKDRQDTQEEEKRLKALSAEAELGLETP